MIHVQTVTLMGELNTDIEVGFDNKGQEYVKFQLKVINSNGAENYWNCVAWNSHAARAKTMKKGDEVCLIGEPQDRTWMNKDKGKCYNKEVRVNNIILPKKGDKK